MTNYISLFLSSLSSSDTSSVLEAGWQRSSVLQHAGVGPVHLGASHGEGAAHPLEDVTHVLVLRFDGHLVLSFSFADRGQDIVGVGLRKRNVCEGSLQAEVNVSLLEVVVVDLDGARKCVGLGVYKPGGLPLTSPESLEVGVDAADVNLQVAVLVEAETSARRALLVVY